MTKRLCILFSMGFLLFSSARLFSIETVKAMQVARVAFAKLVADSNIQAVVARSPLVLNQGDIRRTNNAMPCDEQNLKLAKAAYKEIEKGLSLPQVVEILTIPTENLILVIFLNPPKPNAMQEYYHAIVAYNKSSQELVGVLFGN